MLKIKYGKYNKSSLLKKSIFKKACYKTCYKNSRLRIINYKNIAILFLAVRFISLDYISIFASSSLDAFINKGRSFIIVLESGITKGVLILTAIRLFGEYLNGANSYRVVDILKEGISVLLIVRFIPELPNIIKMFIK